MRESTIHSLRQGPLDKQSDETFAQHYERIAPALYAWASLRVRPSFRGRLDPEDVLQEVWVRALEVHESRDPSRGSFRAWIFAVAKNVLFEAFRKLEGAGGGLGGPSTRARLLANLPDQATAISRRVARDEGLRLFLDRVGRLPREDRMILIHCGLEGLTHAETATRLGLTRDTVAKRWQRLRAKLEGERLPRELLGE